MIDKLDFRLKRAGGPSYEDLFRCARENGIPVKLSRLTGRAGDRREVVRLWRRPASILVYQRFPHPHRIFSTPSAFGSFARYELHLLRFFSKVMLDEAIVDRLDLAIDLPTPLRTVMWGLDCGRKATISRFSKSGQTTGMNAGKDKQVVKVYDRDRCARDRRRPVRISEEVTRVEAMTKGNRVPVARFGDLRLVGRFHPECLAAPFEGIGLRTVRLFDLASDASISRAVRHTELRTHLDLVGWSETKKRLGRHGNFWRTYRGLIESSTTPEQPHALLLRSLRHFFATEVMP